MKFYGSHEAPESSSKLGQILASNTVLKFYEQGFPKINFLLYLWN